MDFLDKFHSQHDIIFFDIELPNITGMEAAQRLRQQDLDVKLVFVTNMAQYAIRGYAGDAMDYVLKAVSYFDFSQRMSRDI